MPHPTSTPSAPSTFSSFPNQTEIAEHAYQRVAPDLLRFLHYVSEL